MVTFDFTGKNFPLQVPANSQDVRAALRQLQCRLPTDAARRADDDKIFPSEIKCYAHESNPLSHDNSVSTSRMNTPKIFAIEFVAVTCAKRCSDRNSLRRGVDAPQCCFYGARC